MSRVHCVKPFPLVHSFYVTRRGKWRGQCSTYVCFNHVWKQQGPSCYSSNGRQRPRDQSSITSTDVMLLVAFTHWRSQAEFGVTLMCHLDLDTSRVGHQYGPISVYVCACLCVDLQLVLHKQENVDLLSIIPQERASLEGMEQQKQGHCGWWMAGSNLVEAVVCWRGFLSRFEPEGWE